MPTALTLTASELARLEALQEVLLTPLGHESIDHWRAAVNARARELFQAGVAAFALPPADGRALCYSEDLSPHAQAVFNATHLSDAGRERVINRQLEVWNQTAVISGDWGAYHRDPTVNEFLKPNGLLDAVGLLAEWPALDSSAREYGCLTIYHDRYGTERMGDKAILTLRLLLPAFKAGVRAVLRAGEQRRVITGALDSLRLAVQLRLANGRVLHETPAFARLLASDAEPAKLKTELELAARVAATSLTVRTKARNPEPSDCVYREVRTATARYRVHASAVTAGVVDPGGVVMAALERVEPKLRSDNELRDRYRLTPREIQVARLMAEGLPNSDIARRLGTSIHTIRRHAEHAMMKLTAHRRAEVGAKLRAE